MMVLSIHLQTMEITQLSPGVGRILLFTEPDEIIMVFMGYRWTQETHNITQDTLKNQRSSKSYMQQAGLKKAIIY